MELPGQMRGRREIKLQVGKRIVTPRRSTCLIISADLCLRKKRVQVEIKRAFLNLILRSKIGIVPKFLLL